MGVDIGPFRNIVGVHWGDTTGPLDGPAWMAAHFWWQFLPGEYKIYPCNEPHKGVNTGAPIFTDTTDLVVGELMPDDRKPFGGFYDVMTDLGEWIPPYDERIGHSGTPATPPPFAAPEPYEFGVLTGYRGGPVTKTLILSAPLDGAPPEADPTFNKQLFVHYQNYQNEWASDVFCDASTDVFLGSGCYDRIMVTNAGIGFPSDLTGLRLVATAVMNFSDFKLTWLPSGRVYQAVALQPFASTGAGGRVIVLCLPVDPAPPAP